MSQLRVEEIRALDGTETTEVNIPALEPRLLIASILFNGSTNTILSSHNVSSITDSGTGSFTVNFQTAIDSSDYVAVAGNNSGFVNLGTRSVNSISLTSRSTAGSPIDSSSVYLMATI